MPEITIYHGKSKSNGKEYFSVISKDVVDGVFLETSGFLYPDQVEKLQNAGHKVRDVREKK